MQANEFVKSYGFEYSKMVLRESPESANYVEWYPIRSRFYISDFGCNRAVLLSDLKRIVEALELVESYGGVSDLEKLFHVNDMGQAKIINAGDLTWCDAKQAIADVESCL